MHIASESDCELSNNGKLQWLKRLYPTVISKKLLIKSLGSLFM